jgi:hypothetical protein
MPLHGLSYRHALVLLGIVVVAWGVNWPVTKTLVREMSPLWSTALRCKRCTVPTLSISAGSVIVVRHGAGSF